MSKEFNPNEAPEGYIAREEIFCTACAFNLPYDIMCPKGHLCDGLDRHDGCDVIFIKKLPAVPTGIEKQVCDDIVARQQKGIEKYGTTVVENPLTHKQWLKHAYEEALDMAIYLKRAMQNAV